MLVPGARWPAPDLRCRFFEEDAVPIDADLFAESQAKKPPTYSRLLLRVVGTPFGRRSPARPLHSIVQKILDLSVDAPELVGSPTLERFEKFSIHTEEESFLLVPGH